MSTIAVPAGLLEQFSYGKADQVPVLLPAPAVATDAIWSVPIGFEARVLTCRFSITTDANAANRVVTVQVRDGDGNVFEEWGAGVFVTASTTVTFQGQLDRSVGEWANTGSSYTPIWFPIDDIFLQIGWTVRVHVVSMQAADQLTSVRLLTEQFETSPATYPLGVQRRRARTRR